MTNYYYYFLLTNASYTQQVTPKVSVTIVLKVELISVLLGGKHKWAVMLLRSI